MNQTPLYNLHLKYKAHMREFSGWQMPIYYTGIIAEHKAVRQKAGLFDISHMVRLKIEGIGASDLVQRLTTNDVSVLKTGDIQYSLVCNQEGNILDDILVFSLDDGYLLVVNAGNKQTVLSWFKKWAGQAEVKDISNQMSMAAIQGPISQIILQKLIDINLSSIKYYHFTQEKIAGITGFISRTGYTGEDGFELCFASEKAKTLWLALLSAGKDYGLQPIGLGARDTLRLEAALPLYGHELSTQINPFEAGLERFVKLDKGDFLGRRSLIEVKKVGINRKLVGFEMIDRGIPRAGYTVSKDGKHIGQVTSGSFSPTLDKNIGMGYVGTGYTHEGCEFEIEIRGKSTGARVVKTPFYKKSGEGGKKEEY